jgi:hypothetical protein
VNISRHGARLRRRILAACSGALRRVAANAWPLLQSTAAATAAWWLARWLDNHPNPFFAPIAAVVALNASRGQRGANALRLLAGVVVGIVAGELAISALGGGYGTLALAVFTAMAAAFALGGVRVTIAQAASGAILTVAVADGQAGPDRLVDALIGASGTCATASPTCAAPGMPASGSSTTRCCGARGWHRWSTRARTPATSTCSVAAACCSRGPPWP